MPATITPAPTIAAERPAAIKVDVYDKLFTTHLGTIEDAFGKSFQKVHNDIGAGTFSIGNEDADVSLLGGQKIVTYSVHDFQTNTYTTGLPTRYDGDKHVVVSSSEEVGEMRTISGRSTLADFDKVLVHPSTGLNRVPFSDSRTFGYQSPEYNDSAWISASERNVQYGAADYGGLGGFPFSWPHPATHWIASSATPVVDDPLGTSFFRKTFTLATDEIISIYSTADDGFRLSLDGVEIMHQMDPEKNSTAAGFTYAIRLNLKAGTHTLAAEVENFTTAHVPNLQLFICAVYRQVAFGSWNVEQLILESDSSWKCLHYPSVRPGMNPGEVMNQLMAEAQARSELVGWSISFSVTDDSASVAWANEVEWQFAVGSSLLEVLRQMSKGFCDFKESTTGLALHMFNPEGGAADKSTTTKLQHSRDIIDGAFDPNVTDLSFSNEYSTIINSLLVRWAYGYFEVEVPSSVTAYGKSQKPLSLPDIKDPQKALDQATNDLDALWERSQQTDVKFIARNTSSMPYKSYDTGDWISITSQTGGSFDSERIMSMTCVEDANGNLDVTAAFISVRINALIRLQRITERMSRGSLAGKSDASTPVTPWQSEFHALDFEPVSFSLPGQPTDPTESGSPPNFRQRRINAAWISAEVDATVPGTTNIDTIVIIKYNGSALRTLTLAAGNIWGNVAYLDGYMVQAGTLSVELYQFGFHANINIDVYTSPVVGDEIVAF